MENNKKREYGSTEINIVQNDPIFFDIPKSFITTMSHSDSIDKLPKSNILAKTVNGTNAIFKLITKRIIYGFQFHPEVSHTEYGMKLLDNWCSIICVCKKNWRTENFIENEIKKIKDIVQNDKVIMALSGGVDSTVCAALIHKAIGNNLICINIDNGLMRKMNAMKY